DRLRHAQIVDRRADLGAKARAVERQPKAGDQYSAADDEKAAIGGKLAEAEIDLTTQLERRLEELRQRPPEVLGDSHRHEHEADSQEHLVELIAAIETAVEHPLEHDADRGDDHDCAD